MSPVRGITLPISEVDDPIFSQKMVGDGYAIKPTNGVITAPFDGTVKSVFPTKHALTLVSTDGVELLMHLGIDTVELNGEPFDIIVQENDGFTAGQRLGEMNRELLKEKGKDDTVMLIFPDKEKFGSLPSISPKEIGAGEELVTIEY